MKRLTISLAALLLTVTAYALPEHVLFAIPRDTWTDASPTKRDKIKTFFGRFADPNAQEVVGVTKYVHEPSGTKVYICAFWTQHLTKRADRLTQEKIDTIKAQLSDNNIRIKFTDDIQGQLAAWSLVPFGSSGVTSTTTSTTTTTVSTTSTTTTTRGTE